LCTQQSVFKWDKHVIVTHVVISLIFQCCLEETWVLYQLFKLTFLVFNLNKRWFYFLGCLSESK
jgi:hypothetical protein